LENQLSKAKNNPQEQNEPLTWYKVWMITMLHPTSNNGEAFLAEGNITLLKSIFTEGKILNCTLPLWAIGNVESAGFHKESF
jgi:hypothetical protein